MPICPRGEAGKYGFGLIFGDPQWQIGSHSGKERWWKGLGGSCCISDKDLRMVYSLWVTGLSTLFPDFLAVITPPPNPHCLRSLAPHTLESRGEEVPVGKVCLRPRRPPYPAPGAGELWRSQNPDCLSLSPSLQPWVFSWPIWCNCGNGLGFL